MATRHLYECEDVVASLLTWIFEDDVKNAVAAFHELRLSEEHDLLQKTLVFASLLQQPSYNLFETQDPRKMLTLLLAQGSQPFPSFVQNNLEPPTEGSVYKPLPSSSWPLSTHPAGWSEQQASRLWYAVKEALRKNNLKRAAYLSGVIKEIAVMESFLKSLDVSQQYLDLLRTWGSSMLTRTTLHCLASVLASASASASQASHVGSAEESNTKSRLGGRKGRTFAISAVALALWGLKSKPVLRLQGEPTLVFDDEACEYWVQTRNTYGAHSFYEACEEFHVVAFPDDIPDEWSCEERAKSHDLTLPVLMSKSEWIKGFKLLWV